MNLYTVHWLDKHNDDLVIYDFHNVIVYFLYQYNWLDNQLIILVQLMIIEMNLPLNKVN